MALFRPRPSALQQCWQVARCLAACDSNAALLPSPEASLSLSTHVCKCSIGGPSTSYSLIAQQHWSHRTFFGQFTSPQGKAYKERRLIGYSPDQLYEVVSSVQHYHQFVPWCVGSKVLKRHEDGSYLEAELQIGFQMISERYTSRVKLQAPHTVSSTVANSALFHHLESTWQMKPGPNPNSTWLSFSVDFAFLNPLYANIAQLFFSEVVTRMMGAFEGRCKQLYGPPVFFPAGQKHLSQQQQQQRKLGHPRLQLHHQHKHQPTVEAAKQSQELQDLPQVAAAGLAAGSSAGPVLPATAALGGKAAQQQHQRRQQQQQQQHQQQRQQHQQQSESDGVMHD